MEAISDYCRHNPHAADTINGIIQYWIGEATERYTRYEVECALERLVQSARIARQTNTDGEVIYSALLPRRR